jgi:small subunit ribosomal protein S4e
MVNNHLKRIKAPRTWQILRKAFTFISRPNPGAHKYDLAVSLNTFLKEMAGVTHTTKDTKYLLTKQEVQVNGIRKRDEKHQVGFLDMVKIPSLNKQYLVTINEKGKLQSREISEKDTKTIVRITNKTILGKDKVQINTLRGINILVSTKEASKYKVGDSLLISVPDQKIHQQLPRQKGAVCIIYTGKHAGKQGKINTIEGHTVQIQTKTETFETLTDYVIVTGTDKTLLEL